MRRKRMADMAYIASRSLENKIAIAENNDLNTVFLPLIMMKEILAILKDQKDTINELQNAYGYLQKQFFKAQDKLLKKQEKKKFLVDSDGKITPLPDVVMCKDCKYYDGNGTCMKNGIASLTDNWFCADGERD